MNTRRSKRKVVQEQVAVVKTKRQKKTQRKEGGAELDGDPVTKESDDRRRDRKSGRRGQKVVNYNENRSSSEDEDQSETREDPEYMQAEEEGKINKGSGAKKGRQVEKNIKKENVVPNTKEEPPSNRPFEVTLKNELNLSSDEDSDFEDRSVKKNMENGKYSKTGANKIHSPNLPVKKENVVEKAVKESLVGTVVSKKPVRKQSLFDDSDDEDSEVEEKEEEKVGKEEKEEEIDEEEEEEENDKKAKEEEMNEDEKHETVKKSKNKKVMVKLKKVKVKTKKRLAEKAVEGETGSDDDHGLRKMPKRKSRLSTSNNIKKEEDDPFEDDIQDASTSKQVVKRRNSNKRTRSRVNKANVKEESVKDEDSAEKKEVKRKTRNRNKKEDAKVFNEMEVTKDDKINGKKKEITSKEEASDSSDEEWEDVEDIAQAEGSPKKKKQVDENTTSTGLEIDIELPGQEKKRKSYDWATYFRRQLNRFNKERQIELHKVHLLCLLANGFHRNQVCNDELLQGVVLSLIPPDVVKAKPKKLNIDFVYKLLFWFRKKFEVDDSLSVPFRFPVYKLIQSMQSGKVSCDEDLVTVFVICIRALGGDARLVLSFQPVTWKAEKLDLNPKGKNSTPSNPTSPTTPSPKMVSKQSGKKSSAAKTSPEEKPTTSKNSQKGKSPASKSPSQGKTPSSKKASKKKTSTSKKSLNHSVNPSETGRKSGRGKSIVTNKTKNESDEEDIGETPKRTLRKRKASTAKMKRRPNPLDESSDEEDGHSSEGSNYSEEEWIHQKKTKKRKRNSVNPNTSRQSLDESMSSDSDFEIETLSVKKPQKAVSKLKKNNKILSSDSDKSIEVIEEKPGKNRKKGVDVWAEIFVGVENTWVSVDCVQGFVNKPSECETQATQPLLYVVGFDNENCAKDITQRYASRWMAYNIKIRIEKFDDNWWKETLSSYKSKKKKRDKDEDKQMQAHNLDQPLPKSIVEYKNHPLYALKRHLLKFEGIYPETAAVLGYCRGEPVYSRECVHTLKSKHTWMKEARVVKDGEKPYKFVKKLINPFKKHLMTPEEQNQMLDIYGEWQTEPYIPPPAKDGIVPRNEYGNVELFQPSMLPKGTVHLKIPGLNKVANKLDIDCAPAMMGWEFHKKFACPILDGFIVCEEFADVLVAAWEEEQAEQEKKRKLKREQRAMKHWKHLIKSVLIREKLKEKYKLEEDEEPEEAKGKPKGKAKKKKTAATKDFWPQNKMTTFEGDASNLLPFEKESAKT